jgi:Uma2 family endonuclease
MSVLAIHRFNVKEYYRMAETGLLKPDARVELLDGQIIDRPPISPFHAGVTNYLNELLAACAKGRWLVAVQDPVHLDDHSEPQPDVMLLKRAKDFYRARHPGPKDVLLLIEVADTSADSDREEKIPAYARAGIAEVWLLVLQAEAIEVYRQPHRTGYASMTILKAGETARPLAFPDVGLDVTELLRRV